MNNIEKITETPIIFGTTGKNAREHKRVTNLKDLKSTGVNFTTYGIRVGEKLFFPKFEDLHVEWVAISKGSENGYYLVKCLSEFNGVKKVTYFALPTLYKRDIENVPVQPSWYDLGDNEERLRGLSEMGVIEGLNQVSIDVPVFEDGKRIDGAVKTQNVVIITPYERTSASAPSASPKK